MSRFTLLVGAFLLVQVSLPAQDPDYPTSVAYLQQLQTMSGGFLADATSVAKKKGPTLRATASAVRALHYLKGVIPENQACMRYVAACHDGPSGGFADTPKGKPDLITTAIGLMALKALGIPADKYGPGAVKFMTERASTFEEIRIAAAGLEAIEGKSSKNQVWIDAVLKMKNAAGTYGKGAGQARDTGGAVVTLLRLGAAPKEHALDLKVLRDGQRLNGGYGKEDGETTSDLESTYRVMRCFMMLKAQPERVDGLRAFVAKCRNADGGYGVAPGQPSSVSGTYYAASILHWQGK